MIIYHDDEDRDGFGFRQHTDTVSIEDLDNKCNYSFWWEENNTEH